MRVAYIMSRFPHLPETFILREMSELRAQGWDVSLFPLLRQEQQVVHAEAKQWLARAHTFPPSPQMVVANLRALRQAPGRYASLWLRMVWEHRVSPPFLARALYLFPLAVQAAAAMRAANVAHIHAHYATHPALAAWLIHKLTGISYSITVHAHDIFVNRTMLPTKLRDAAFVAAISDFNRDFLAREIGGWAAAKTHVVRCGIDPARYSSHEGRTPLSDRLEILAVGSLQPYKGLQHLVAACAALSDREIPFCCKIVGEGEERDRLEALIRKYGLQEQVQLLGAKTEDEVATYLAAANCYVQPSVVVDSGKMEGIPVSLMEALAAELPVVASDLSGIPELVRSGETGYLVPPADPRALATTLARIHHDPNAAIGLAKAGRALVLDTYDLRDNVSQLATLFERALADS